MILVGCVVVLCGVVGSEWLVLDDLGVLVGECDVEYVLFDFYNCICVDGGVMLFVVVVIFLELGLGLLDLCLCLGVCV